MAKGAPVVKHLKKLNTIVNQLVLLEIRFDDEVHAVIILALLPYNQEPMRVIISNSIGNAKLKFHNNWETILAEESRRKDSKEVSISYYALNVETRDRIFQKIPIK